MTADEAQRFRTEHDMYVRILNRKITAELRDLYRRELSTQGIGLISGGPVQKDELIAALADANYPQAKMDEASHVLYHQPGETWSACGWCAA